MPSPCYFAAWTDSEFLLGCDHEHPTVISAVVCAQSTCAGAYVIAVEQGFSRELSYREEREFKLAMYGRDAVEGKPTSLVPVILTNPILS